MSCEHNRQKVEVGNWKVLATQYSGTKDLYAPPIPDLGVYLARYTWSGRFEKPEIIGNPKHFGEPPTEAPYPVILVDWDDWGMPEPAQLEWLVEGIVKNILDEQLVEIGCYGGHGRTGTLIACVIGVAEGLLAREAILTVRERYCDKAVESLQQIYGIAHYLGGEVPKELYVPPPKVTYYTNQ